MVNELPILFHLNNFLYSEDMSGNEGECNSANEEHSRRHNDETENSPMSPQPSTSGIKGSRKSKVGTFLPTLDGK
jgi:hypothetical protein